jgi:hypothetical protein
MFVFCRSAGVMVLSMLAVVASGCGDNSASSRSIMTEADHSHYHVHAVDASHDHSHADGAVGGHEHAHQHGKQGVSR